VLPQHEMHLDLDVKRRRLSILHIRLESPLAHSADRGGDEQLMAANHGKIIHRALGVDANVEHDIALNVLPLGRVRILWLNLLQERHLFWRWI
jgi:hypothetical protein